MDFDSMIVLDATGDESQLEVPDSDVNLDQSILHLDTKDQIVKSSNGEHDDSIIILHTVPSYDSSFTGILTIPEFSMETGKHIPNDAARKKQCFNCSGDHNIDECKEKRDQRRIAANRSKMMRNRGVSAIRYHDDPENKYTQFQPGKISESLRYALNLRDHQLPEFIYRMRKLGYPPGWLKEAEVHRASVTMFDETGQEVDHPENEEGEDGTPTVKYKPEKLIGYPGFNVDIPRKFKDEWQTFRSIPMQQQHRKEEFEKYMNMNKAQAYKRKKLKGRRSLTTDCTPLKTSGNMDLDESIEESCITSNSPQPGVTNRTKAPRTKGQLPSKGTQVSRIALEEGELTDESSQGSNKVVEELQQKIIGELDDIDHSTNKTEPITNKGSEVETFDDFQIDVQGEHVNQDSPDDAPNESNISRLSESPSNSSFQTENSSKNSNSVSKRKRHHNRSKSVGVSLGVHIPDSCTPFIKLPESDLWTVDVHDHILFDNLPDALGTWDQMKGLVKKVKKQMAVMHRDDD